jgi:hypothetical protein
VGKEAGAGGVKVASIGTGQVKAEELNSPLSRGAGVVGDTQYGTVHVVF